MNKIMKKMTVLVFGIVSMIQLGCASSDVATVGSNQRHIVNDHLSLPPVSGAAGSFNSRIIFMADQLERNLDRKSLSNTVIITSFANLNKLSETTSFGRLVSENLIHEMQVRKWQVFEVRLTKDIVINETGEFTLSRDIKKLKDQYQIGGVVTGTYSVSGNDIIVNARAIDLNSGIVVSSAQSHMPLNWFTEDLLTSEHNMKAMKIVGDTAYSCRDIATCGNNAMDTNTGGSR